MNSQSMKIQRLIYGANSYSAQPTEQHTDRSDRDVVMFAFPASPWFMFGGPKVVVPLSIALVAALLHLSL